MLKYLDEDLAYFLSNGKRHTVFLCTLAAIMTFSIAVMCFIASLSSGLSLLFITACMSNLAMFGVILVATKFHGYKLRKGE